MDSQQKFNRQVYDFLLTDLLPYEKGNHYTHIYLYNYLLKNKNVINKIVKDMNAKQEYFNNKWHSAPINFKISKSKKGFRDISLINPLGLIESLLFLELFEADILGIIHNKYDFSARKPNRTNTLSYKKSNNSAVYYSDDQNKKQLLISLESKGTYFRHYPVKTITDLLNSDRFVYALDKYKFLLKLDIQNFFPDIYTHSYKWLVSNKSYDSKALNRSNSVYRNIDIFLTNINESRTNGIIVGPEISRLIAEFLLIHLDQKIYEVLAGKDIIYQTDYVVYRFIDDYFIFTRDERHQNYIYEEVTNLLSKYQLKINESKVGSYNKGDVLNGWLFEIQPLIESIEKIFSRTDIDDELLIDELREWNYSNFDVLKEVAATVLKSQKRQANFTYKNLRRNLDLVISRTNEQVIVSSYVLSTILSKVEIEGGNKEKIGLSKPDLINFLFYTYTRNITYSSTQKVIRTLTLMLEDDKQDNIKNILESSIERFKDDIFIDSYISEWIDLLFLFSSYNIHISNSLVECITSKIMSKKNPIQVAAICLFYDSELYQSNSFYTVVNDLVKDRIQKINWNVFFEDKLSWWVFIFFSYPNLCAVTKGEIKVKLEGLVSTLEQSCPANQAKLLVLNFLLNKSIHFIEWDFTKENYHKKFYFYTKDRTVFFPDIIEGLSISR